MAPAYQAPRPVAGSGGPEVGEESDLVEAARGHAMAVARELSRNRLPHALAGRQISVVDERGVVVFKGASKALRPSKGSVDSSGCRTA